MKPLRWRQSLLMMVPVIVAIAPLIWTLLASVNLQPDSSVSPPVWRTSFSLEHYQQIREEQTYFLEEFATALLLAAATTGITLSIAYPAAYALVHSPPRFRQMGLQICLILACFPVVAYVTPLAELLRFLCLYDSFVGLALAESALFASLAVYLLAGYLARIPPEIELMARLDGAGLLAILLRVMLPAILAGMIAVAVLIFILSWNQFILPAVLTGIHLKTLPVRMRDFFTLEREFDWRVAAAVIVLSISPVTVFVALIHRLMDRIQLYTDDVE